MATVAHCRRMLRDRSISRRRFVLGATTLAASVPGATHAAAPRKLALVFGNGNYAEVPLDFPERDALAMARLLSRSGFRVLAATDLSVRRMRIAINDLAVALRPGDLAVFYYSGYALQFGGRNYLMPIATEAMSERAAQLGSIGLREVVEQLSPADRGGVVLLLDACRPNPYQRALGTPGLGLAAVEATPGVLYAYATLPGQIAFDGDGKHSHYTAALLEALARPGVAIEPALDSVRKTVEIATVEQQVPWYISGLKQPVVLKTR
jgi:uncharacterized caspase-like protein